MTESINAGLLPRFSSTRHGDDDGTRGDDDGTQHGRDTAGGDGDTTAGGGAGDDRDHGHHHHHHRHRIFCLTDRDAANILGELERDWRHRVNMSVLEATGLASAVALLAAPEAGMSAEVVNTAQRLVSRWREKMERAVAAMELRVREMR